MLHAELARTRAELAQTKAELQESIAETKYRVELVVKDQNYKVEAILDFIGADMKAVTPNVKKYTVTKRP